MYFFSGIFIIGNNLYDFHLASLANIGLPKWDPLLKERIAPVRVQNSSPQRGDEDNSDNCSYFSTKTYVVTPL